MRNIAENVRSENMIPVVRARLAMVLQREGLRVTEIAAALNTTPAAVVQYLKGKRGRLVGRPAQLDRTIEALAERILELAKAGATTTQVATKLGLNYRAAQEYVEGLLGSSHLRKHLKSRNMVHELAEKGELFLAGLKAIKRDTDEVFSPPRPSTVLAEDQSRPYSPWRGSRPFRAPPETRQ